MVVRVNASCIRVDLDVGSVWLGDKKGYARNIPSGELGISKVKFYPFSLTEDEIMGDLLIHQVDDQFVVSYNECWIDGVYSTLEAARMAVHCDPDKLHELWVSVRPKAITNDMLRRITKYNGGLTMTKLFEVGDKVRCHLWKGVKEITSIEEGALCPIRVAKDFGDSWRFLADGRYYASDSEPTLRHAETGKAAVIGEPPERFEYPLYRRSRVSGAVVEFDSLTAGTVLERGTSTFYFVGEPITDSRPHTDAMWEPCEKPKWKPTKPTWCWVWDDCYAARVLLFVIKYREHPEGAPSETDYNYVVYNPSSARTVYRNAVPCKEDELPNYWPKEWV